MSITFLNGDALSMLKTLPDKSIHCVVTSPPYYMLRSYLPDDHPSKALEIGLEPTPAAFIAALAEVFAEVRRVLRRDGTCWINIGDSRSSSGGIGLRGTNSQMVGRRSQQRSVRPSKEFGLKRKDLIGIPWRLAFALQDDGWFLREEIIWEKPNVIPESCTDRPTRSHEQIFLLSRSGRPTIWRHRLTGEWSNTPDLTDLMDNPSTSGEYRRRKPKICAWQAFSYFYDQDAIAEPSSPNTHARIARKKASHAGSDRAHGGGGRPMGPVTKTANATAGVKGNDSMLQAMREGEAANGIPMMRNKRSVWRVHTAQYRDAHFATFPPELIEPCILAGCPVGGTVLDPFAGSGTTGQVADRLGRKAVLIDLDPDCGRQIDNRLRGNQRRMDLRVA